MLSYRDFFHEAKPIPSCLLDESLNVWFNYDEENLGLYHMFSFAVENGTEMSNKLKFLFSWKPSPHF